MFQAWCDAYAESVAYNDMCEGTDTDLAASEIPSEEAMHQLVNDTVGHELARRAFDYGVFELLWPRRDASALDDMTRLVLTFAALRVRGGPRAVRLHIDLIYRTAASSTTAPDRCNHVASLRYRDRLWAASQIAELMLEDV